jgi:uncharacterized protein
MRKNPVIHFELPAEDRERAKAFYSKAFDWKMNQLGAEMGDYVTVETAETDENNMVRGPGINGGIYQKHLVDPLGQQPTVVIAVENLEESTENIKSAGGTIHGTPYDIPGIGRYVSFIDTEGNRISILEPKKM